MITFVNIIVMQTHNCSVAGGRPGEPITPQLKEQIAFYLQRIPLHTGWGFAARDFLENRDTKSTSDYESLLCEMRADLQDGPGTMRDILGSAYRFFRKLVL